MENRNKYRLVIVALAAIAILLLLRSCIGGGETPLEQAKLSLLELQQIEAEGGEVDEELVAQLVQEIVEATELAIEDAEENSDLGELQDALEEIESLQSTSLDVFEDLADIVEGEAVEGIISEAIAVTEDEQEQVNDAIEDVETSLDQNQGEQANNPADLNNDGIPDELVDSDGDGVPDSVDYNGDGVPDELVDSDGDGVVDSVDYDGDGVADEIIDVNGDGVPDGLSDGDGDGILDSPAIFMSTPEAAHEGDTLDVLMTTNASESAIENKIEKEDEADKLPKNPEL
ncbi:MAG: hypothetical protein ABID64_01295 [Nitrospirota bacterium]